jgi:tRNA U34 5-methylaminomethyl-2-thiouridine-forming methyltransferase MnmC
MVDSRRPQDIEVEELLRNAELRNALEPFYDESISRVNVQHLPLAMENEFLASMLAWEQAPVLPIYRWFEPELRPPRPGVLTDENLHGILWDVIEKLYEKRIVLDFTEHLSDRELYQLIYRDILPSREKKIDSGFNYLHWDCTGPSRDPEIWLRYYATEEDRELWAETYRLPLPGRADPPYPRDLPREG